MFGKSRPHVANPIWVLAFCFSVVSSIPLSAPTGEILASRQLSQLMKWAAIGDSYASGVAAGARLPGAASRRCSRFDGSYPVILNNDPALGDNPNRQFRDFACSGSKIADVLNDQVPQLDTDEEMVTLTVGGNNVGFADLVDACIYQFRPRPADCETQIQANLDIINGDQLSTNLDAFFKTILSRVSNSGPAFRLYVTGYASFWNDATTQCNGVSWSFWNQRQNRVYSLRNYAASSTTWPQH